MSVDYEITPEPTPEQLAAIVVVLDDLRTEIPAPDPEQPASRWRQASRREALRGELRND